MVESMGLMWEEERGRCGGRDPPPPPPDPAREPRALCHAVDHVRAQFQVRRPDFIYWAVQNLFYFKLLPLPVLLLLSGGRMIRDFN